MIQHRLHYKFISNSLQKFVTKGCLIVKGFWKFNSSFTKDQNYIIEIIKLIRSFGTANTSLFNHELKWADHITEGICIRSKCDWYEPSKKSKSFFKSRKTVESSKDNKKLIVDDKQTIV